MVHTPALNCTQWILFDVEGKVRSRPDVRLRRQLDEVEKALERKLALLPTLQTPALNCAQLILFDVERDIRQCPDVRLRRQLDEVGKAREQ